MKRGERAEGTGGREREGYNKGERSTHTHLFPEFVIYEVTSEILLVLKLLNWDGQLHECRTIR